MTTLLALIGYTIIIGLAGWIIAVWMYWVAVAWMEDGDE